MIRGLKDKLGIGKPSATADTTVLFDGAFRTHIGQEAEKLTEWAKDAFPEFAQRVECFGSDWLGRFFATDSGRVEDGRELVLMLEPGSGEVLEIPCNKAEFYRTELVEFTDAVIAIELFRQWTSSGGVVPGKQQCAGYKVPLFLGGADDVSNLEIGDLEVYWSIMAQLLEKVRGLPPGTKINNVSISD